MPFRYEDHTADLYLVAEGASPEEAAAFAVAGVLRLLWDEAPPAAESWRRVELEAEDGASLVAELLTELLFLVDAPEGWPVAIREVRFDGERLHAEIGFVARSTSHRPAGREVKAVSRRELELLPHSPGHWRFRCLLDL